MLSDFSELPQALAAIIASCEDAVRVFTSNGLIALGCMIVIFFYFCDKAPRDDDCYSEPFELHETSYLRPFCDGDGDGDAAVDNRIVNSNDTKKYSESTILVTSSPATSCSSSRSRRTTKESVDDSNDIINPHNSKNTTSPSLTLELPILEDDSNYDFSADAAAARSEKMSAGSVVTCTVTDTGTPTDPTSSPSAFSVTLTPLSPCCESTFGSVSSTTTEKIGDGCDGEADGKVFLD